MPDLFAPRRTLKPYEYPGLVAFKDAMRHSYWVHDEFNFTSDIQDFRVRCTPAEQSIIERTMLAIAQIEVSVKMFWADIYKHIPKPEVAAVGVTYAESETRHADAYSHLLEQMGLNEAFEGLSDVPAIADRISYLSKFLGREESRQEYIKTLLLFSVFIEHVSLFSQFLIMCSFDKHEKRFSGIANAVEATSKEEHLHGLFGIRLVEICKEEHPEWFTEAFYDEIKDACRQAYKAEEKVLDWILEEGELEFLPRPAIENFLKDKFNRSLEAVGTDPIFTTDDTLTKTTAWFQDDILTTKGNDFFAKRGTTYTKHAQPVSANDLF